MITEKEYELIYLLSDTELYPQAEAFINGIGATLPPTQINGLLNVALDTTYAQLQDFVEHQHQRKSWPPSERHVPEFYFKLKGKLKELESYVPSILGRRPEKASHEDEQTLKVLLAREFIQHLLAENAYMGAKRTAHNGHAGQHQSNNRGPRTR